MAGIFISYRRADSPDATGRIYDRLVAEFGRAQVFKDIDSIPLGRDFRSHLNEIVGDCAVVLAIVGPHWADMRDEAGKRRLEDADDFVRIELEAALARNIPVVPVLVGHALMPASAQLPASLAQLAFRQSIEVRPDPDFHNDATRLVSALRRIIDPTAPVPDFSADVIARTAGAARGDPRLHRRLAWMTAICALAVAGLAAALLPALRHLREAPPPEMRVDVVTPASGDPSAFALSPDGRQIVFEASGRDGSRLWLRSLAATTAQPLAGTEGGSFPFWSPDGRSIGFVSGGVLKRLDLGGGAPVALATGVNRSGTWNEDGGVLFERGPTGVLARVSASGGVAEAVLTHGRQQPYIRWPYFLPGGRQYLYQSLGGPDIAGIYLGALDGSAPVRLIAADRPGVYLPSGWLLWQSGRNLVAQRLDLAKAALTGSQVTLANDMGLLVTRSPVSVAMTGLIAYRSGADSQTRLAWFDRSGRELGTFSNSAETTNFQNPRFSPDGQRVVVQRDSNIWLLDGARTTRFTFDTGNNNGRAVWSPDGSQIAWASFKHIGLKLANGAGASEQFDAGVQVRALTSWSADGRFLLYHTLDDTTVSDLWIMPMVGDHTPSVFLKTRFDERGAEFSPDGRWVAYNSDESGRQEIFLRPFVPPGAAGATSAAGESKWQVSTAGGAYPAWRQDGKELYYLNPAGAMMAAPITMTGATPGLGAPVELFPTRIYGGGSGTSGARQYDVARDGRFLINTRPDDSASTPITLILNWSPEARPPN